MKNNNCFSKLAIFVFLLGVVLIIAGCGSGYDGDTPQGEPEALRNYAVAPESFAADDAAADDADLNWDDTTANSVMDFEADDDFYSFEEIYVEHDAMPDEVYTAAEIIPDIEGTTPETPADAAQSADLAQAPATANDSQVAEPPPTTSEEPAPPAQQTPTQLGVDLMQRMIIRTASMTLNTLYYQDTADGIDAIVQNRGGFIESSRQWLEYCSYSYPYAGMLWRAEYVIRVPVGLFDTTNNDLMTLAQVQYFSTTSRDATNEFNDLGSRLIIREAEEVRVQRMLDDATMLSDIIALETRLTNLRLVIDAYRRRREEIDQLASFSTINLNVYEFVVLPEVVEEEEEEEYPIVAAYTFGERMSGAFRTSASATGRVLEMVAVFLAAIILPGGLLVAFLMVVYFGAKKISGGNLLRTKIR